jgi:hypothetical protein
MRCSNLPGLVTPWRTKQGVSDQAGLAQVLFRPDLTLVAELHAGANGSRIRACVQLRLCFISRSRKACHCGKIRSGV